MTREEEINRLIAEDCDTNQISDGYHTFGELYEHRIVLFITLCRKLFEFGSESVWRSQTHSDGSVLDGWFILGIGYEKGEQITYHLPMSKWRETDFAAELGKAPEFDGHYAKDTLQRLENL